MTKAVVSLGSNLGNRIENLNRAVLELSQHTKLLAQSKVYETDPMYVTDQPAFLNAAAVVETDLGPLNLLQLLKETERKIGRTPTNRFGPREIDLDLITYGAAQYQFLIKGEAILILPHPRAVERRFVLQPIVDMEEDLLFPGLGRARDLLAATDHQSSTVREIADALLPVLSR